MIHGFSPSRSLTTSSQAHLADGRTISVPLVWSWRLSEATPAQRQHFEIIGTGQGVHWPNIDEDISAIGMLTGTPRHLDRSTRCNDLTGIRSFRFSHEVLINIASHDETTSGSFSWTVCGVFPGSMHPG